MQIVPSIDVVSDPKQAGPASRSWYRYYAGYSPKFVADALRVVDATAGDTILDPWMGAGTTLAISAASGFNTAGLDLNPSMVVVTKARLLSVETRGSLLPLAHELLDMESESDGSADPLSSWFTFETSGLLRRLAQRIDQVLIGDFSDRNEKVDQMSSLAAFYYVALFTVVKESIQEYRSKNPTWTKRSKLATGTVALDESTFHEHFLSVVRDLQGRLRLQPFVTAEESSHEPKRGDTRKLPFETGSIDHVITSPPYCTRLDYVVGHRPELAVLGYLDEEVESLRHSMIGTPTIQEQVSVDALGSTAAEFIRNVEAHSSYASKSYYAKTFRQYFAGMVESMASIDSVLKDDANIIMVVQDSRYKDLHLDLAQAVTDIANDKGWRLRGQKDFTALRSIAQMNSRAAETTRKTKPVESVLHFERGK